MALGVRDAYLTGLKSRSCQQLPGVLLCSVFGVGNCSSLPVPVLIIFFRCCLPLFDR